MPDVLPEGRYANSFNIGFNAFEFIVDFSQHVAERPESHVFRVITSPHYAKLLLETLRESISRYDGVYGEGPRSSDDGSKNMPERPDPRNPQRYEPRYGGEPGYPEPQKPKGPGGYELPVPEPPPPKYPPPHPEHEHPEHTQYGEQPEHPDHPDHPDTPGYGGTKPTKPYDRGKYCPKPDDQIKTLQRTLEEQTKKIQTLEKQRNSLKDDITGLQQTATELTAVLTAYKEACKALKQEQAKLALYIQTKTPMIEAGIGDQRPAVDECIHCIDHWINGWSKYAAELEPKAKAAEQAAEEAAENAKKAQTTYDDLKNSAKTLEAQLKALNALRDQIEQEDDKNKIGRMYFLFKELKVGMARITLLTPEELEQQLCQAWTDLNEAKHAARDAKAKADATREAAERAKTRAADAKTRRRDLILQCIDLTCPPSPPPAKAY
jgi:hypothetical protein